MIDPSTPRHSRVYAYGGVLSPGISNRIAGCRHYERGNFDARAIGHCRRDRGAILPSGALRRAVGPCLRSLRIRVRTCMTPTASTPAAGDVSAVVRFAGRWCSPRHQYVHARIAPRHHLAQRWRAIHPLWGSYMSLIHWEPFADAETAFNRLISGSLAHRHDRSPDSRRIPT